MECLPPTAHCSECLSPRHMSVQNTHHLGGVIYSLHIAGEGRRPGARLGFTQSHTAAPEPEPNASPASSSSKAQLSPQLTDPQNPPRLRYDL